MRLTLNCFIVIKHFNKYIFNLFGNDNIFFLLIRYGVAPDHPEVKNVINQFSKVAQQPNVNFYGNITLGKDITLLQLRQNYNAVLLVILCT